jgi:hypothetical protein
MMCPPCRNGGAKTRDARLIQASTISTHNARSRALAAKLHDARWWHGQCEDPKTCTCGHFVPDLR